MLSDIFLQYSYDFFRRESLKDLIHSRFDRPCHVSNIHINKASHIIFRRFDMNFREARDFVCRVYGFNNYRHFIKTCICFNDVDYFTNEVLVSLL